jgi:hypothetical protein
MGLSWAIVVVVEEVCDASDSDIGVGVGVGVELLLEW